MPGGQASWQRVQLPPMNSDLLIRMSAFIGVFTLMALWEIGASRRSLSQPRGPRWFANITVVVLDSVIVRLLFAAGAVGMAMLAAERNWGVLNQLGWPIWLNILQMILSRQVDQTRQILRKLFKGERLPFIPTSDESRPRYEFRGTASIGRLVMGRAKALVSPTGFEPVLPA